MRKQRSSIQNIYHEGTVGSGTKYAHYWIQTTADKQDPELGKIVKMIITIGGKVVADYDRGWKVRLDKTNETAVFAYNICLREYA